MGITYVFPLIYSLNTSFKTMNEFYGNIWGLPEKFLFSNYLDAWQAGRIGEYFVNSLIIFMN